MGLELCPPPAEETSSIYKFAALLVTVRLIFVAACPAMAKKKNYDESKRHKKAARTQQAQASFCNWPRRNG